MIFYFNMMNCVNCLNVVSYRYELLRHVYHTCELFICNIFVVCDDLIHITLPKERFFTFLYST